MSAYDVVVAGLGAMGSAACDHLAGRGRRVLGLDRFAPPHTQGSSHGESRIIREAYFEHPAYVPLVQRAYELWRALERDTGHELLRQTGGLMIGPREGAIVTGALKSAETHRLEHRLLDRRDMQSRYPQFALEPDQVAVWEPRAGYLAPEACVSAQLERARRRGAELHTDEPVLSWSERGGAIEVVTPRGRYQAAHLVLAAGAWIRELLEGVPLKLEVERVTLYWFDPGGEAAAFGPDRMPIWIWEHQRDRFLYGFPLLARGLKVARHHEGEPWTPGTAARAVSAEETSAMQELVRRRLPGVEGPLRETASCLYTNSPDQHFVIDAHPANAAVTLVSACSGHGFKFAAAIGELIADRIENAPLRFELDLFRLGRFAGSA